MGDRRPYADLTRHPDSDHADNLDIRDRIGPVAETDTITNRAAVAKVSSRESLVDDDRPGTSLRPMVLGFSRVEIPAHNDLRAQC